MLRPRLLTLLTILAIAAATTATPGSAQQVLQSRAGSREESGTYVIRAIRGLDGKSVDLVGMDRRGDIVGTCTADVARPLQWSGAVSSSWACLMATGTHSPSTSTRAA